MRACRLTISSLNGMFLLSDTCVNKVVSMNSIGKIITITCGSVLMTGCVTQPQIQVVRTTNPIDPAKTLAALKKGTSVIKGSALLRQQSGGVVTCAGNEVYLNPVTNYSTERVTVLFGSPSGGYRPANVTPIKFEPDNEVLYASLLRRTRCDAQGFFKFENVAQGDFFVSTNITWSIPAGGGLTSIQGGAINQKIPVLDGETKDIVLTAR